MKVFTYSEARQNLARLLDLARTEDVVIRRRTLRPAPFRAKMENLVAAHAH